MELRDYAYRGTTQSLCPDCLAVVPAKIITRGKRVYFRKTCPTHGVRDDFICSDVSWYDRLDYATPGKIPRQVGVEPRLGCPYDCGLCTEHEQHTCVALVEVTGTCNLSCPMCFASSGPGGKHLTYDQCIAAIDRIVATEGRPEVVQFSGGEPTLHPEILSILDYAASQPIDYLTLNTNGVRLAHDRDFVKALSRHGDKLEIYLQFDGVRDEVYQALRGESLLGIKRRALDAIEQAGLHTTLAVTLQGGVNDDQIGPIVELASSHPHITGINFQPATYSGRFVEPGTLERRITFPDVIRGLCEQTGGLFQDADFMPLPCAHPNCHQLSFAYRSGGRLIPLMRFFDAKNHYDLLANGITMTRPRARNVVLAYLGRLGCCGGGSCCGPADDSDSLSSQARGGISDLAGEGNGLSILPTSQNRPSSDPMNGQTFDPTVLAGLGALGPVAAEFFTRAMDETLGATDLLRITITNFLDAYNFDIRRLMQCCTHHVLPTGHVIPFCAYNVLYREGHVDLPPLARHQLLDVLQRESDGTPPLLPEGDDGRRGQRRTVRNPVSSKPAGDTP